MGELPPLSVGEYSTPRLSFAEDLRVYREAGYMGIGIDVSLKLGGREEIDEAHVAAFRASGLEATFCLPAVPTVLPLSVIGGGPADPAERVASICRSLRSLARFEPRCVVCGTGPVGELEPGRAREVAVEGLAAIARAAAGHGMTLALEPMHPTIAALFSFVTDLPGALALIDDIGEPNTGVLVDVWHLWDSPGLLDALRALGDRIAGVHVNDWRDPTRSWADRVLPGDGIADVEGILGALDDAGYDGPYELEVFSDDGLLGDAFEDSLWALDPLEMLRENRRRFEHVWRNRRRGE